MKISGAIKLLSILVVDSTNQFVKCTLAAIVTGTRATERIDVLIDPGRVAAILSPIRRRLLQSLAEPDSASGLARKLDLPRQKINYHLRELERAGFVELVEERQQRGCTERLVKVTARTFLISEDFLGGLAANPDLMQDRFSSAYLIAAAGRVVRDVAALRQRASRAEQKLATIAIEANVSFASAGDFKKFSEEMAEQLARLSAKYSGSGTPGSRRFRVLLAAHPIITKSAGKAEQEVRNRTKKKETR